MAKQSTKNKLDTSALRPLLRYAKPHMWLFVMSMVFAVITVATTLYAPILVGNAVDLIIAKGLVDFDGIINIIIKLGVTVTVTGIAQWLMSLCTNKITYCKRYPKRCFRKAPKATPFLYRLPPSR